MMTLKKSGVFSVPGVAALQPGPFGAQVDRTRPTDGNAMAIHLYLFISIYIYFIFLYLLIYIYIYLYIYFIYLYIFISIYIYLYAKRDTNSYRSKVSGCSPLRVASLSLQDMLVWIPISESTTSKEIDCLCLCFR